MNYRCPKCSHRLKVRTLFFHDISTCPQCGTKVVLGDFLAFFMAALSMSVIALATLYVLTHQFEEYFVAAGYAIAGGMAGGIVVLLLLGRARPFRHVRIIKRQQPESQPAPSETSPQGVAGPH